MSCVGRDIFFPDFIFRSFVFFLYILNDICNRYFHPRINRRRTRLHGYAILNRLFIRVVRRLAKSNDLTAR